MQEMTSYDCGSSDTGTPIVTWHKSGYTQTFSGSENLIQAAPGETRYFRCDEHCSTAKLSVTCPAGQPTDAPTPASGASKHAVPIILAGVVVKLSVLLFLF